LLFDTFVLVPFKLADGVGRSFTDVLLLRGQSGHRFGSVAENRCNGPRVATRLCESLTDGMAEAVECQSRPNSPLFLEPRYQLEKPPLEALLVNGLPRSPSTIAACFR
jgi:hypothetical protein